MANKKNTRYSWYKHCAHASAFLALVIGASVLAKLSGHVYGQYYGSSGGYGAYIPANTTLSTTEISSNLACTRADGTSINLDTEENPIVPYLIRGEWATFDVDQGKEVKPTYKNKNIVHYWRPSADAPLDPSVMCNKTAAYCLLNGATCTWRKDMAALNTSVLKNEMRCLLNTFSKTKEDPVAIIVWGFPDTQGIPTAIGIPAPKVEIVGMNVCGDAGVSAPNTFAVIKPVQVERAEEEQAPPAAQNPAKSTVGGSTLKASLITGQPASTDAGQDTADQLQQGTPKKSAPKLINLLKSKKGKSEAPTDTKSSAKPKRTKLIEFLRKP